MFGARKKKELTTEDIEKLNPKTEVIEAKAEPSKPEPPKNPNKEAADYFEQHYVNAIKPSFDEHGEPLDDNIELNLLFAIYCETYKANHR